MSERDVMSAVVLPKAYHLLKTLLYVFTTVVRNSLLVVVSSEPGLDTLTGPATDGHRVQR